MARTRHTAVDPPTSFLASPPSPPPILSRPEVSRSNLWLTNHHRLLSFKFCEKCGWVTRVAFCTKRINYLGPVSNCTGRVVAVGKFFSTPFPSPLFLGH
ncbi:hypothetical protein CDAR_366731 [Caerostris darwini]|uniref:Uncharacterized protein n=1 Tax=Caerostris darwini TaxID=1538125 RepID=A0AAV4Q5R8_9ARAC|nr:hypothetical protein CDAR_366731 [Caerostris darwini]